MQGVQRFFFIEADIVKEHGGRKLGIVHRSRLAKLRGDTGQPDVLGAMGELGRIDRLHQCAIEVVLNRGGRELTAKGMEVGRQIRGLDMLATKALVGLRVPLVGIDPVAKGADGVILDNIQLLVGRLGAGSS